MPPESNTTSGRTQLATRPNTIGIIVQDGTRNDLPHTERLNRHTCTYVAPGGRSRYLVSEGLRAATRRRQNNSSDKSQKLLTPPMRDLDVKEKTGLYSC